MKSNGPGRGLSNVGRFAFVAWAVIALTAISGTAYAQAAATYGIVAGSSATATAKTAGTINRATNKLAGRVAESVSTSGSKYASRSLSKPYEIVMEENRRKLEDESKDGGGTLHVESVPDKATVLIDGEPVATTPADLKLPVGEHTVELREFESVDWKKEIFVTQDENLSLKPELKKRYQSAVTVSFD